MTVKEIAISFREAKDRQEQLMILAQLNACTEFDIYDCLQYVLHGKDRELLIGVIPRSHKRKRYDKPKPKKSTQAA